MECLHTGEPAGREVSRRALVLSLHPDSSGFRHWVGLHASAIDWPWVLRRARAHKVAALLAARVEECGLTASLDAEVGKRFHDIQEEAHAHATVAQRTLQRLTELFGHAGIPFFVIKGSVLAERVYGDARLRRFADVDLVTRREMLEHAEALLRTLGYRFGQVEELLARSPHGSVESHAAEALTRRFYERFQYELPFDAPHGGELLPVDLHWHVASALRLKVSAQQLWDETIDVVVAGTRVTTFNPAATLIHLAVHASTCALAAFRLLHFCDVGWAAWRWHDQADSLWALADTWRVTTQLGTVLDTVERGLGFPIPTPLRRGTPRHISMRPALRQVATEAFLLEAGRDPDWSRLQRVWAEVLWNLAMGCLRWNVLRSIRTRLTRLQWAVWQWRGRGRTAS
jgi:hypothetical protein